MSKRKRNPTDCRHRNLCEIVNRPPWPIKRFWCEDCGAFSPGEGLGKRVWRYPRIVP
jgi:hypothetical protein